MILHKKYFFIILILSLFLIGCGILQMRLSIYRVEGTSMIPTYHENDLLLVSQVPINEIKPFDVIAFSPISWQLFKFPLPLVCHRVITISYRNGSTWYTTKGDNNILLDPPSPYISIVGKVILRIPFSILLIILVNILVALISVYLCKRLQTDVTNNKNRPSLYNASRYVADLSMKIKIFSNYERRDSLKISANFLDKNARTYPYPDPDPDPEKTKPLNP